MVVFMTQKLYAFVGHEACAETSDSVFSWEVYLAGDVYLQVLKDAIQTMFNVTKAVLLKKANSVMGAAVIDIDESEFYSVTVWASNLDTFDPESAVLFRTPYFRLWNQIDTAPAKNHE